MNFSVIPVWNQTHDEWQEARRGQVRYGGSDVGSILGWNKYKASLTLWAEKTGKVDNEFTGNEATEWGQILERPVAEKYAADYGVALVAWPVIILSDDHEFMSANIDFLEVEPSDDFPAGEVTDWHNPDPPEGVLGIVEVKSTGIATHGSAKSWRDDSIPPSYLAQGYWYGISTGWHRVTFVVLIAGEGLQIRHLPWDDKTADWIVQSVSDFHDLVTMDIPPDPDGTDDAEAVLGKLYPTHTAGILYEGGADFAALWENYEELKAEEKNAIEARKRARSKIVAQMRDAETATVNGQVVCTFRNSKDVEFLDTAKLKKAYPDIAAACMGTRPGPRTMRGAK